MFTPALFTSTSTRPCSSAQRSIIASTARESDTSVATADAEPPMADAVSSAAPPSMSAHSTRPPSSARRTAMARPIPEPAPVTTQALPSTRGTVSGSGGRGGGRRLAWGRNLRVLDHATELIHLDRVDRALEPVPRRHHPPDPHGPDHHNERDRRV